MKQSRAVIVAGGSAAILGTGFALAPDAAPSLDLGGSEPGETTEPAPGDPPPAAAGDRFTGPAVDNIKGTYQLEIVVVDGEVVDVEFLAAGSSAAQSVSVNAMALPILEERILEAQHWDVEYVSGASFTSPAMVVSAQGAFEDAGLG